MKNKFGTYVKFDPNIHPNSPWIHDEGQKLINKVKGK